MQTNKNPHKTHPAEIPCEECKRLVEGGKRIYQSPDYG